MNNKEIQVGDTFPTQHGETVTVLFVGNNGKFLVEFNDEEKYQCFVEREELLSGYLKSPYGRYYHNIGCLGDGEYKIGYESSEQRESLEFIAWLHLLTQVSMATVDGNPFRVEWLNFQNFAEWYINSDFYGFGYELNEHNQWSKK